MFNNSISKLRGFSLGSKFVKFDEGPVRGVVIGPEVCGNVEWDGKCFSHNEERGRPRLAVNFFRTDTQEMGVLEGPSSLLRALLKANIERPIDKSVISISRLGLGAKTRFLVQHVGDVNPEIESQIGQATPFDLASEVTWVRELSGKVPF